MRSWGILFGVLVVVAGCAGKSQSDGDDSAGSANDAGDGGTATTGAGQGGGTAARGGSSGRGGTSTGAIGGAGAPRGGTAGDLAVGATGGTLSSGGMPGSGGTLGSGGMPSSGGTLGSGAIGGGGTGSIGVAGYAANGGTGGNVDPLCTDLSAQAPSAQFEYRGTGTPPAPQGGTIASGSYYLALEAFYGPASECEEAAGALDALGYQISEVVRFTAESGGAGSMEVAAEVSSASGGAPMRVTGSGTYATSGTELSVTGTCGNGVDSSAPIEFTAAGDQLVMFSTTNEVCTPTIAIFQRL